MAVEKTALPINNPIEIQSHEVLLININKNIH
jgi:hypothetical protein